jgi:hypothetical protein
MKINIKKICIVLTLSFCVIWILTGGIVINQHNYISPDFYQQGEYAPLIYVDIDEEIKESGIRFLFQYRSNCIPFAIKLRYISDKAPKGSVLCFDLLQLTFADGHKVDIPKVKSERIVLKPYPRTFFDDYGNIQQTKSVNAEIDLGHCIDSRQKFTLHLIGYVKDGENIAEPFNTTLNIEWKTKTDVYFGWLWYFMNKISDAS